MLFGIALEHISACTRGERRLTQLIRIAHGQDSDLARWNACADLRRSFDAAQPWHLQIENRDIRPVHGGQSHCFLAVSGFCTHPTIWLSR